MGKEHSGGETPSLLRPVETQRASEAIYDQIKDLIVSGQLKPGDRLPSERNMMEMLQRSRPTIREALRMLERSGFIRTAPGTNGAVVQELGTEGVEQSLALVLKTSRLTLDELVEYRTYNDTLVCRWAAQRHTREDITAIKAILDQCEGLIDTGRYEDFMRLDSAFHAQLAKAAKNEVAYVLTQVMGNLVQPINLKGLQRQDRAGAEDMCRRVLSMHRKIYEAVRLGAVTAAEEAMTYHIGVFGKDHYNLENQ